MKIANHHHDVVIVGGRVAGAATAMLLARLGHDVVVVDRASFPSDTTSTHAIARSGVVQLRRWGLLDAVLDSGAPAIRQVTFHAVGESVSRTIKHKAGVDFLVAPRRYVLDTILAAAADSAGADVRTGVTVTGVQRDGRGRVIGVSGQTTPALGTDIGARYVVGADGLRSAASPVRRCRHHEARPRGRRGPVRLLRRRSRGPASSSSSPNGPSPACSRPTTGRPASGSAPLRRRRGGPPPAPGPASEAFGELLERAAPQLAERLRPTRRTSPVQGHAAQPNQVRRASGPGWALVGDAGYHRDAVTAARHQRRVPRRRAPGRRTGPGALTGRADETRRPRTVYQQQRDRALREIFEITCRLAAYPAVPVFIDAAEAARAPPSTTRRRRWPPGRSRRAPPGDRLTPVRTFNRSTRTLRQSRPTPRRYQHDHHRHDRRRNQRLDPQRRRHRDPVRHPRRREAGARGSADSSSGPTTSGSAARTTAPPSSDFFGVGEERTHERTFVFDADHPAVLVGRDHGPTPVEFVLHALAACLTAGLANIAAARRVTLTEVRSRSPATSTSTASSGSTPTCATATRRSPCASPSRATHRPRSCARSSSSRAPARRSTTSSPTRCR